MTRSDSKNVPLSSPTFSTTLRVTFTLTALAALHFSPVSNWVGQSVGRVSIQGIPILILSLKMISNQISGERKTDPASLQ